MVDPDAEVRSSRTAHCCIVHLSLDLTSKSGFANFENYMGKGTGIRVQFLAGARDLSVMQIRLGLGLIVYGVLCL